MSRSSEKYLISSILRDGDFKTAMAHSVTSDMFHAFKDEWSFLEDYYLRHKKVPSKLAFRDTFPEFTIKAVNDTGHFSDEVKKQHSRYLMMTTMKDVADLIADGKIDQAVQIGYTNMIQIAGAIGNNNDSDIVSSFEDVLADASNRVKRVRTTGSAGIPTGFDTLDDRTGGPAPGQFWVVGARLGQCKSWTLQRMATTAIMNGYTVVFDALEQTRPEVTYRVHSFLSSQVGESIFKSLDLMQGRNFDMREYKRFLKKLKGEVKGKLHISDASRGKVGVMNVAAQIERHQPDIVYIDYLTLMDKKGSEWQDISALSGGVKQVAAEYQVPIVAAAQLNRTAAGGKGVAGAEAIAQSDTIGQDADALMTLRQVTKRAVLMGLPKNRNGEGGFKWYNRFEPDLGVFEEVSYDRFCDLKDQDAAAEDD